MTKEMDKKAFIPSDQYSEHLRENLIATYYILSISIEVSAE